MRGKCEKGKKWSKEEGKCVVDKTKQARDQVKTLKKDRRKYIKEGDQSKTRKRRKKEVLYVESRFGSLGKSKARLKLARKS